MPSRLALRAFETVAGHASFKAAADEFHVTAGAPSHRVKKLEEEFGVVLGYRSLSSDDVRKGRLMPLFGPRLSAKRRYSLVYRNDDRDRELQELDKRRNAKNLEVYRAH